MFLEGLGGGERKGHPDLGCCMGERWDIRALVFVEVHILLPFKLQPFFLKT